MKLFEGNTIKKVNKLLDKGEKRKEKLKQNIAALQEERKGLREAEQDDINSAVLEGTEPSKKLKSDRLKVQQELQETQEMLEQVDGVIQLELEKHKASIEEERRQFVDEHKEEFRMLFDELNEAKLAYLNKVIEYRNKQNSYTSEYRRTFQDVANRVGLSLGDSREHNKLNLNQRSQIHGRYSPMIYPDEVREAFMNGKLTPLTERNKDAFKN